MKSRTFRPGWAILAAALLFFCVKVFVLDATGPLDILVLWVGISIAMHAIPSRGDAKSMWNSVSGARAGVLTKVVVGPLAALIYVMSIASIFWADLIYGVAICMAPPTILVHILARS